MTLSSITQGVVKRPDRILIYGVGGIGKTTFLSEAPGVVFIDTQDGTKNLAVARYPKPETWLDVLDALDEELNGQHEHKTLAIDLLDDIEHLIWAHICRRDGQENVEAYGYGAGYKVALNEWRLMLSKLEQLRSKRGMQIAFGAHSFVETFKNPEGPDYDRYGLQLQKLASGLLRGWCDIVLFARQQVSTSTDKRKRTRGVSNGSRVIHSVETAAYYAKNRDGLPDVLSLDWAEFAAAREAGAPATPEALRSEIAELAAQGSDTLRAAVEAEVGKSGDDANRLVRVLNRLREKVQPQEPASAAEEQAQ